MIGPQGEEVTTMLVDIGDKVHVIERRMFDSDVRRHFFGAVERVEASAIRITGYVYVYDSSSSTYVRGKESRTRVIPLAANGFVINVAPRETNLDDVRYVEQNGRLTITDGGSFALDINEFGRLR
ncbi:MAG: hypothetical protein MUQ27_04050 [Acidimicrobiia bacterium]|nr:hypothetical protein [Acidimicrobiia bacterium]